MLVGRIRSFRKWKVFCTQILALKTARITGAHNHNSCLCFNKNLKRNFFMSSEYFPYMNFLFTLMLLKLQSFSSLPSWQSCLKQFSKLISLLPYQFSVLIIVRTFRRSGSTRGCIFLSPC